ncbi:MAG: NUDIX domain-containing protein [Novosphingobium sp.]|nr:NUDIX domain-containing protein [Novosphingobium sp.]
MIDTLTTPHDIPVRPAATLVIFRDAPGGAGAPPELMMVTRSGKMAFAGGATVFPGGRVDEADFAFARDLSIPGDLDERAAHVAAIRETLEETDLAVGISGRIDAGIAADARAMLLEVGEIAPVLAHFGWSIAAEALTPFARWLPKLKHKRIFDTRFFLANLGTGDVQVAVDRTENTHLFWSSAQATLDMADRGDLQIIFPTRRNLERLAQFNDFAATREHALSIPPGIVTPILDESGEEPILRIPEGLGYPVTSERLGEATLA